MDPDLYAQISEMIDNAVAEAKSDLYDEIMGDMELLRGEVQTLQGDLETLQARLEDLS